MLTPAAFLLASAAAGAGTLAPSAALPAPGLGGVSIAGRLERGWVPPFRVAERDQEAAALTVHYAPGPAAALRLYYEALRVRWPDGSEAAGSGDIRLGASGRLAEGGGWLPAIWVDWQAKLPNAPDTSGLGTDETDVLAGGALAWELEPAGTPLSILASGALAILGNPLMFANQDDAAVLALLVETHLGPATPYTRLDARLASPRNPADITAAGGLEWAIGADGAGPRAGAEGRVGLTPAAADRGASLWIGYAWGCPLCQED